MKIAVTRPLPVGYRDLREIVALTDNDLWEEIRHVAAGLDLDHADITVRLGVKDEFGSVKLIHRSQLVVWAVVKVF